MSRPTILVTGATGFLGRRLTEQLLKQGSRVRAFARPSSNISWLEDMGAEIHIGDVQDLNTLISALENVAVVVHAAADTSGDALGSQSTTVQGTQNVIDAANKCGVQQLIYLSSCSVYGITDCQPWQRINENGPLERHPENRGHYSNAKFKAEQAVLKAIRNDLVKITCLRPGTIWGPGGEIFTPMMGFKVGQRIIGIIGSGRFILPLIYIDNLVSSIITCIDHPRAYDQVFNVVDAYPVNKQIYTREVLKPLFPNAFFFNFPYFLLYVAVGCQEMIAKVLGRKPLLTRYRLISSQRPVVYNAEKIARNLEWAAPVDFNEAVRTVLQFEAGKA